MKKIVDDLDSKTGWTGSVAGITFPDENEVPDFIAGLGNVKSVIVKFTSGSINEYAQKSISDDLSDYDELTLHIWSRNKKRTGVGYQKATDFSYKIEFGGSDAYYIPCFDYFTDFTIDISSESVVDKIKITALHDDEDYIIISYLVASKDELPVDIFEAVKEHFVYDIGIEYGKIENGVANKGILVGTVSASVDDTLLHIETTLPYLDKYAVIYIDDGVNTETHQLGDNDGIDFQLMSSYDGGTILNDYINANIYLTIPVNFGLAEQDISLPGIAIWGMPAEEIFRGNKEDTWRDTFKTDGSVGSRIVPSSFKYVIEMHGEARHNELIAIMSKIIRLLIAKEFIWINGKKIDISPEGAGVYIEPIEGASEIPKITYLMNVEIKEEVFDRATLVATSSSTKTYIISEDKIL